MSTRTRLARFEAERLASYLGSLSPEGWDHSTACDLWQVGDVVGHLVWIGEFYVTFITRALAGDVTPPPGSPRDERYAGLPPEDFYDLKAREYRDFMGNQILPTFVRRFDALSQVLESLTPDDYEKPCFYHSGNRPVWTLADLTVQELAVHAWDIQSRTEPGTPLSPESQPVLLERVVQRPQPAVLLTQTETSPATLRFQLAGAVSRAYVFTLTLDTTRIEEASDAPAMATLSCDAETFIMALYRRQSFADAIAAGRISLSGDEALAKAFAQAF
jgi:uncharacterized protein (TIGR03083 family)